MSDIQSTAERLKPHDNHGFLRAEYENDFDDFADHRIDEHDYCLLHDVQELDADRDRETSRE